MSHTLTVQWTIEPQTAPRPLLACSRCGGHRPFLCSDKTRLNANGCRLDAWLIYRCAVCEDTWNRPIFERRNVANVDPDALAALQGNDPAWIRQVAFDIEGLRQYTDRIEDFADCHVERRVLSGTTDCARLEILLVATGASSLRVDRLLSTELAVSRARLTRFEADGLLTLLPEARKGLQRPIRHGSRIVLDLAAEDDRAEIAERARGAS
ncbi:DUF1062 domain-containing protein [Ensifer adhaerens]|uniref:DUF1062 domain-containing protein n=1 Tax=Ensifer adhaerens TaxID=106592 RepID=UPI00098FF953|nr:DUF1062 domain-containing protein [Ensifer adhaerens]